MYPVRRSVRPVTGDAALLDDEGADRLLVDACTPPCTPHLKLGANSEKSKSRIWLFWHAQTGPSS